MTESKEVIQKNVKNKTMKMQKIIGCVTQNELDAINLRKTIISSKQIELNLLTQEKNNFLMIIQDKYKLSKEISYFIDKEGKIIQVYEE